MLPAGAGHDHDRNELLAGSAKPHRRLSRGLPLVFSTGLDHLCIYLPKLAASVGIAPGAVDL